MLCPALPSFLNLSTPSIHKHVAGTWSKSLACSPLIRLFPQQMLVEQLPWVGHCARSGVGTGDAAVNETDHYLQYSLGPSALTQKIETLRSYSPQTPPSLRAGFDLPPRTA